LEGIKISTSNKQHYQTGSIWSLLKQIGELWSINKKVIDTHVDLP